METRVQPAAGERSVRVTPNDIIVIQLPENPTTGYQWDIDRFDEQLFGVEASSFSGPQGPAVGAGGTREIRVRPKAAGRGTIHLKNARVWEPPEKAANRVALDVEVTGQGG